jgi:predicted methyltransferase
MDVVMTTLLLNLQELKYKSTLDNILNKSDFVLSDVVEQLETLQKEGIVKMEGSVRETENKETEI